MLPLSLEEDHNFLKMAACRFFPFPVSLYLNHSELHIKLSLSSLVLSLLLVHSNLLPCLAGPWGISNVLPIQVGHDDLVQGQLKHLAGSEMQ